MRLRNMHDICLCGALSAPRIPDIERFATGQFVWSRKDWDKMLSDLESTKAKTKAVAWGQYIYVYLSGDRLIPFRYTHKVIAGREPTPTLGSLVWQNLDPINYAMMDDTGALPPEGAKALWEQTQMLLQLLGDGES